MKSMTDFIGERDEPETPPPMERIVLSYGGCGSTPWHRNVLLDSLKSKNEKCPLCEIGISFKK